MKKLSHAVALGLVLMAFAELSAAQTAQLVCVRPGGGGATIVLTIDYSSGTMTYVDRFPDRDSPPIVTRARVTSTNIGWSQNEDIVGTVTYDLSRVTGELNYWYYERGDHVSVRRTCAIAQPKF